MDAFQKVPQGKGSKPDPSETESTVVSANGSGNRAVGVPIRMFGAALDTDSSNSGPVN